LNINQSKRVTTSRINELGSLGVDIESNRDELKDKQENSDLVESIKQTFMQEYMQTYHR
jgi:hypothetical protein